MKRMREEAERKEREDAEKRRREAEEARRRRPTVGESTTDDEVLFSVRHDCDVCLLPSIYLSLCLSHKHTSVCTDARMHARNCTPSTLRVCCRS